MNRIAVASVAVASVAVDWLDTTGSVLSIALLVGSFALIAVVVWTRRKR